MQIKEQHFLRKSLKNILFGKEKSLSDILYKKKTFLQLFCHFESFKKWLLFYYYLEFKDKRGLTWDHWSKVRYVDQGKKWTLLSKKRIRLPKSTSNSFSVDIVKFVLFCFVLFCLNTTINFTQSTRPIQTFLWSTNYTIVWSQAAALFS